MLSLRYREHVMVSPGVVEEFDSLVAQLRAFLSVAHNDDGTLIAAPAAGSVASVAAGTGVWTDVPFNAADFFTKNGGAWGVLAGDVLTFAYMVLGKTMWVTLYLTNTDFAAAPADAELRLRIPGGHVAARLTNNVLKLSPAAGVHETGNCVTSPGVNYLRLFRQDTAVNYPASNLISWYGTVVFSIQ